MREADRKRMRQTLTAMEEEFGALLEEQDFLKERIAKLRQSILSLRRFLGSDAPKSTLPLVLGLSDACREILRMGDKEGFALAEIAEHLRLGGHPVSEQANPLASISTIVKRLVKNGQATTRKVKGRTYYVWRGYGDDEESPPST